MSGERQFQRGLVTQDPRTRAFLSGPAARQTGAGVADAARWRAPVTERVTGTDGNHPGRTLAGRGAIASPASVREESPQAVTANTAGRRDAALLSSMQTGHSDVCMKVVKRPAEERPHTWMRRRRSAYTMAEVNALLARVRRPPAPPRGGHAAAEHRRLLRPRCSTRDGHLEPGHHHARSSGCHLPGAEWGGAGDAPRCARAAAARLIQRPGREAAPDSPATHGQNATARAGFHHGPGTLWPCWLVLSSVPWPGTAPQPSRQVFSTLPALRHRPL